MTIHYKDLGITVSITGNDYSQNGLNNTAAMGAELMCYAISQLSPANCLTGIHEIAGSQVTLSPNPVMTGTQFRVTAPASNTRLELVNALGQVVYSTLLREGDNSIPLEDISAGIYSVRLIQGTTTSAVKLIVTSPGN
ncbi:MAG TPA: T9SS type A sorting domain-containing protein [Bacteroidia bacterium]|nr:T9SS type A sorting domain-containing protein [Bacteroidia bacterium]